MPPSNSIIVIGRNMQHNRHQEFIRVLSANEPELQGQKRIHVIASDCATPEHVKARK
jgi:hypothetical protein